MNEEISVRGERQCPVCQQRMILAKKGKVEIDVCERHGVWLDVGELDAITRRVERLAQSHRRGAVRRAREDGLEEGRTSACLFGPLAFLFD